MQQPRFSSEVKEASQGRLDDDMSMSTARAFVFILAAAGIVLVGLIIGFATWWFR